MTPASDSSFDQELPRELRAALDSMTTPDPRPEFRSKLRDEFVAGEIRCSDTTVETALASWDAPPARPEFRAACREAFVSASVAQSAAVPERGKLLRFLPLAAAAAVLLLLLPELFGDESKWERLEGGSLTVDGTTVVDPTGATLERTLQARGGCGVEKDGEKLLLRYVGSLLVEADPGTRFSVNAAQTDDNNLSLDLTAGAVRVSGKPGYEHRIAIRTPDASIVMRGEAIGVDVLGDRGTCVCCLDGDVQVDPVHPEAANRAVRSGSSIWIPRGSADIKVLEAEVHHREPLEQVRMSARTYFY